MGEGLSGWFLQANVGCVLTQAQEENTDTLRVGLKQEVHATHCLLFNYFHQIIVPGVWEESQLEYPLKVKAVFMNLLSVHNIL